MGGKRGVELLLAGSSPFFWPDLLLFTLCKHPLHQHALPLHFNSNLLLCLQVVRTQAPTDAPKPLSVSQAGPLGAEECGGRVLEWMAGVAAGVQKRSPVAVALHVATWTS